MNQMETFEWMRQRITDLERKLAECEREKALSLESAKRFADRINDLERKLRQVNRNEEA